MAGLGPFGTKRKRVAWYLHYQRRTMGSRVTQKVLRANAKHLPPREPRLAKATDHHRLKEHTRMQRVMEKRGATIDEFLGLLPIIVGTDCMSEWAPRVLGRLFDLEWWRAHVEGSSFFVSHRMAFSRTTMHLLDSTWMCSAQSTTKGCNLRQRCAQRILCASCI